LHGKLTKNRNTVEDYRPGYPRFAAIIGAHKPFQIARRFSRLRSRLLLYKQDEISVLEAQLDAADEEEISALYLGNRRRDQNEVRKRVVDEITLALREYGSVFFPSPISSRLRRERKSDQYLTM
jgi:hypothetical protein